MVVCPVYTVHNKMDLPAYQGEEDSSHDNTLPVKGTVQRELFLYITILKIKALSGLFYERLKLAAESLC
jgi:hypothetical protein